MAEGKQAGLVKKLFFPAYADAGSNENFQPDGAGSDATTAILDNRAASKPYEQQQQQQYEQQQHGEGYAPTLDESMLTNTGTEEPPRPLLFPETSIQPRPNSLAARSMSTTTRSGIRPFPTTSPRAPLAEEADYSSMTESSAAVSSVVGVNFLNDSTIGTDDLQPTPVKDNRTTTANDASRFEPRLADLDGGASSEVMSDINSNASEMGTVVGAPGRLAEVQAMADFMELHHEERENEKRAPAELSLPTLEEGDSKNAVFREKLDSVFRESSPPPTPGEGPSAASAMVSAALRRLGSGLGHGGGANKSPPPTAAYSAPTTPQIGVPASPKVEDYLRSSLPYRSSNNDHADASFLLRSPGSAVHFQPDGSRRRPFQQRSCGNHADVGGNKATTSLRHASSLASPLRFARGCLSFDNTLDEQSEIYNTTFPSIPESQSPPAENNSPSLESEGPPPVVQSKSWDVASSVESSSAHRETPTTPLGYRSFAFGKSPTAAAAVTKPSAFRSAPASRVRHAHGMSSLPQKPAAAAMKNLSDISPAVANSRSTMALRTPQRIEIEREDALDILACLVERSVAFDQEMSLPSQIETIEETDEVDSIQDADISTDDSLNKSGEKVELTDDDRVSTFADIGQDADSLSLRSPPKSRRTTAMDMLQSESLSSYLMDAVRMIRKISQEYELSDGELDEPSHLMRMKAIDELLRSHTYAAEMKRAAKSASAWLHSIGRTDGTTPQQEETEGMMHETGERTVPEEEDAALELESSEAEEVGRQNQSAGEEQESEVGDSPDKMDAVALKAMLHSAELRVKEKEEIALRLNEELSNCRAEIGRLKTASRAEIMFSSPNRSILDNDDESTTSTTDSTTENLLDNAIGNTSPIAKAGPDVNGDLSFEPSFCRSDVLLEKRTQKGGDEWLSLAEAKKEAALLKAALSQANETIRRLHEEATDGSSEKDAPVVSIDNPGLSEEVSEYNAAAQKTRVATIDSHPVKDASMSPSDRSTVNVRMLDGENFVTEWDDLAPPLPPPPDHGLRSPIVAALLQQWTSDTSMHESLLSWMEHIMSGANPVTVPPLTISSLDHQVRDGFAMHVLPLLLRRSDIHVDVKTRAHSRTSYDMSVSVARSVPLSERGSKANNSQVSSAEKTKKTEMMAYKASHGNHAIVDESVIEDENVPKGQQYNVSDYLRSSGLAHSSDVGSGSATHSTTTTALITNSSRRVAGEVRLPQMPIHRRDEGPGGHFSNHDRDANEMPAAIASRAMLGDDISVSSSTTGGSSQKSSQQQQHPGLMSALGGAFGGLLRRKTHEHHSLEESAYDENGYALQHADAVPSFLRNGPPASPSRADEEGQPYHRVVSAPPGRIGVTFVEYRGHAMVSDVAQESPLSGWVFPSDILIAIDEVPVSGMRVRDIVKLLTSRKERQRALRVISSHAMNEFTLNTATPSEIETPS